MKDEWAWNKAWCEAHNFPYLIKDDKFFWKTNISCAEQDKNHHITWYSKCYFDFLKKTLDK